MGSVTKRRSLTSVAAALLLVSAAVALFGLAVRADRGPANARRGGLSVTENMELEYMRRYPLPVGYARPEGRSPLGSLQARWDVPPSDRGRTIETSLGLIDPREIRTLRGKAPLLAGAQGRALGEPGRRGEIVAGFNALQISEDALRNETMDDIQARLRGMGVVIHDSIPSRAVLAEVPASAVEAVAKAGFVEASLPWDGLFRVSTALARQPVIRKDRAEDPKLKIVATFFRGTDLAEARRVVEGFAKTPVTDFGLDGLSLQAEVDYRDIARLAKHPRLRFIEELTDYMLMNVETPTTAMVGNIKENLPFQKPYQDAGVDGGGLDTNADGRRINDPSNPDLVPPQIVAVTDNGISYDSAQFAQSATLPGTPGPTHRKVHSVQNVGADNGNGCDGTLSGSGTHGNVVAGVVAGDGTSLGFRTSKHIYNNRPKVENLEMDGVARGARILMQDAAPESVCTINDLVERGGNIDPISLAQRLALAICPITGGTGSCAGLTGGGNEVHLHVMPFGVPNFDTLLNNVTDGTYPQGAADIDTFLVNNRDYMVFAPVGNQGTFRIQYFTSSISHAEKNKYPDLFDGNSANNDPADPNAIQVSPPATAKNLVSVGAHYQDVQTELGTSLEENPANFSSKGPATAASLRTAPIILGVGIDVTGFFFGPNTASVAVWRSRDNDNLGPVDAILDDMNFGTSYASGEIAGVAAIIRDYFAQGFYPTGSRTTLDRNPAMSGALVKAAIVASANFEENLEGDYPTPADRLVGQARAINLGTIGIIGNSEQGYGRPVVTSVLPLANWPKGKSVGAGDTLEYPAAGLIVYDELATGELAINNARTAIDHIFRVDSDSTRAGSGAAAIVDRGQLRVAVAWPDPPSLAGSGGLLVNDLDLEVQSPGPDGVLDVGGDDIVYDGNNYQQSGIKTGQWSQGRGTGIPDVGDYRNPVEAVHLSADPNGDGNPADSQLFVGNWRVRVKKGARGATTGQITVLTGAQPTGEGEDANHNGRLDPGEDFDADTYLDANGQPYGLVIAGPVIGSGSQTWSGAAHQFPGSTATLDKSLYGCADDVRASIFDIGTTASAVGAAATFEVLTRNGIVIDTEKGITFTAGSSNAYSSPKIPLREGKPAGPFNGILETNGLANDEPYTVRVRYADTPREAVGAARISCTPSLAAGEIQVPNQDGTQASAISGGCDGDQYMDAGENVLYSVAFGNLNLDHDLTDVKAFLTAAGAGAPAVRILNSPQNMGRIPGGQLTGVSFALKIDQAALTAIPVASRIVDMTLTLQANSGNIQLPRQTFSFRHALNSDNESFHYSTDYVNGGREIRDLNRNLQIDKPDVVDPFIGVVVPDEDIMFDTMFVAGDANGKITNTLGEDLNGNGLRDTGEFDVIPNNALDFGFLRGTAPAPATAPDWAPFNFDRNNGSFNTFRLAYSRPGAAPASPTWEWARNGLCGFQSAVPDSDPANGFQNQGAGIWHTGDGAAGTGTSVCDNHETAFNPATPQGTEFIEDFLVSPIIAKVHQLNDSRGLPYSAEFQRFGLNMMMQTRDSSTGGTFNVDNNVDDDTGNCLLCQEFDIFYGGTDYNVARFINTGEGVGTDPLNQGLRQRTFGPLMDPDGSVSSQGKNLTGDESGFTAFTTNDNSNSFSPIPTAKPELLPYPLANAPLVTTPPPNPVPWTNDTTRSDNGPARNFDMQLIGYASGFASLIEIGGGFETSGITPFTVNPGVRWQIGIGFFNVETGNNLTDYGFGIDDVVFEWDERHPVDEGAFPTAAHPTEPTHAPACNRYLNKCSLTGTTCATNAECTGTGNLCQTRTCTVTGTICTTNADCTGAGNICQSSVPAGQQCATLSVDRTALYECDESITVTVNDPKRAGAGSVIVLASSTSDSRQFSTGTITALHPRKSFSIPEVSPGLFVGSIQVTQTVDVPTALFVSTNDASMQFFYQDPLCDANGNAVVAQNDFDNLDGDGVAFSVDNCRFDYNPTQTDTDLDGFGDVCDDCPTVYNPPTIAGQGQDDGDADGVGDRCDLDDIDFDGVVNSLDNCPDVYNPLQTIAGPGGRGVACDKSSDRDGDGVQDKNDKCVRTADPFDLDSDQDGIGNVCDGDCVGAHPATLPIGSCNRSGDVPCTTDADCPSSGFCTEDPTKLCLGTTAQCTCTVNFGPEVCVRVGTVNSGGCGATDDDLDVDGVTDGVDNCPVVNNPPIIVGTTRQLDTDNDGRGDVCDSPFMVDGDNNGLPDDALSYAVAVQCTKVPLPNLIVQSITVRDLNGDGAACRAGCGTNQACLANCDPFCDTGERCEMTVVVKNGGPVSLTDATLYLATGDSDVQCVTKPAVAIGSLPVGGTVDTANIGGQRRPFEFVASQTLQSTPNVQAKGEFTLNMSSREAIGTSSRVGVTILMDLDLPIGAVVNKIVGPDGQTGTSDDGWLVENFDTDLDGSGSVDISDGAQGLANDTIGILVRSADGVLRQNLGGIGCAGYQVPPKDPGCRVDPDHDQDWHIHCPPGAVCPVPHYGGSAPNSISFMTTPAGAGLAHRGQNSLHWGKHVDAANRIGDTTSFRELAAFMTRPVNLTPLPAAGDLVMSFYHIADMMDESCGTQCADIPAGQAVDYGDVQIRVDSNPDPATDSWGVWDKLVPFENVYDHIPYIWSHWGSRLTYCNLTPTDTGDQPYAPRGVRETMCFPIGVWSHCGSAWGTNTMYKCAFNPPDDPEDSERGPAANQASIAPAEGALWARTRFSLVNYLGARVQIRWIAQGWEFDFDNPSQDYQTYARTWENRLDDDGWWVDDIRLTGVIDAQASPQADTKTAPASTCPATAADNCIETTAGSDRGYVVSLTYQDTNNDGFIEKGETLQFSAAGTTNPGGCARGVTEYRFLKDGAIIQDFSTNATLKDAPTSDATYQVIARCSSDTACTSLTGATQPVKVYTGDSMDIDIRLTNVLGTGVTTISWTARPQVTPMQGYDAFRGSVINPATSRPDTTLATLVTQQCNVGTATPVGGTVSVTDNNTPASGSGLYFLVGHNSSLTDASIRTILGRRTDGSLRIAPVACP